ncbi:MAG: hypothetical protein M3485_09935 [Pseudomonadota bacterium]|nr:hypothetical protein [Pseudomonadota bacterium]
MKKLVSSIPRLLVLVSLLCMASLASAQTVPVSVDVNGQVATIRVGSVASPVADLTLTFDDATGLSASSLGVSAQLVNPADPGLLARLSDAQLLQLDGAFPLLVTIEPPAAQGLKFNRTVRVEVHTHALAYSVGSFYRLFKAPVGGQFSDITDEIAPGSVRARGTTSGFSQFLVLTDLRRSDVVVAGKFAAVRATLATLPSAEREPLAALLASAEAAVAGEDYVAAGNSLDAFRARVAARAGTGIDQQWRAGGALSNPAGALLAGAATLKFSIAYLRDYGL